MIGLRRDALRTLDGVEARLGLANDHSPQSFWFHLVAEIDHWERHPVLGPLLAAVDAPTKETLIWGTDQLRNLDIRSYRVWGRGVYGLFRMVREGNTPGDWGFTWSSHSLFQMKVGKDNKGIAMKAIAEVVVPIRMWLELEVRAGVFVEHLIERWVRRVELFPPGLQEGDADLVEAHYADDLHRFLFDQGMEPHRDFRREEQVSARGRVDFVVGAVDGVVPVELKLWRMGQGTTPITSWSYQAARYRDGIAARGTYLVIVNGRSDRQLVKAEGLDQELWGRSLPLHLKIANPWLPSPSSVRPPATVVSLEDLHLASPADG